MITEPDNPGDKFMAGCLHVCAPGVCLWFRFCFRGRKMARNAGLPRRDSRLCLDEHLFILVGSGGEFFLSPEKHVDTNADSSGDRIDFVDRSQDASM